MVSPLEAFPVDVPENCPYFPYGEAYIPVITRAETGAAKGAAAEGDDAGTALASSLLRQSVEDRGNGRGVSSQERKRQKREVLGVLVRESLGLSAIGR